MLDIYRTLLYLVCITNARHAKIVLRLFEVPHGGAKRSKVMSEINTEKYQAVVASVTQLQADLKDNLKSLSAKERRTLPKMGDGSVAFVEKANEYAKSYSNLVPAFLDIPEMTENLNLYSQLQAMAKLLNPLVAAINDTMLQTGSEAYIAALAFYRTVKNASKLKVQNAKVISDDLSKRFAGIRQNTDTGIIPEPAVTA